VYTENETLCISKEKEEIVFNYFMIISVSNAKKFKPYLQYILHLIFYWHFMMWFLKAQVTRLIVQNYKQLTSDCTLCSGFWYFNKSKRNLFLL
jgi:hypothetical protein